MRNLIFTLMLILTGSCSFTHGNKKPIRKASVKQEIINPLDTILGDKYFSSSKTRIRQGNFSSLFHIRKGHLLQPSKLYHVTWFDSNTCELTQQQHYNDARTFALILNLENDTVSDYFVLNDFTIKSHAKFRDGWVFLCSDAENYNTYWKSKNTITLVHLDSLLKEQWRYLPNHSDNPLDADRLVTMGEKIGAEIHIITGCTMCYSIIRLIVDKNGTYISSEQIGDEHGGVIPQEKLESTFN